MGLLDSMTSMINQHGSELPGLDGLGAELLHGLLKEQPGGVAGVLDLFKHAGLGEQVASWLSSGAALPITAAQVHAVIGSHPMIGQLLERTGLSEADLMAQLAKLLPLVAAQFSQHHGEAGGAGADGGAAGLVGGLLGGFLGR